MKQNNIKIAVTGGIGSGKTTVCNYIEEKGYRVYSCDKVYAELLSGKELPEILAQEFGKTILNSDGTLNRGALSALVFADENKLKKLNEITHRRIFDEMFARSEQSEGVVFYEVPLLFEGNNQKLFDEVIVVLRDEEKRISSVKARDNLSETEIKNRIERQHNYLISDFTKYYVIHNDGNFDNLRDIISDILLKITTKYGL